MKHKGLFMMLSLVFLFFSGVSGEKKSGKLQFIIVLRPVPRLLQVENWTEEDRKCVDDHIAQLKQLLSEGKLILAGSTIELDPTKFGIVILEVDQEKEAREIMENDAGVKARIFTAELFPFSLALVRE
jgi:uncharacterized protein YciI